MRWLQDLGVPQAAHKHTELRLISRRWQKFWREVCQGAVGGRKEILEELDFEKTAERGREKIQHPGTFNANPVSATAGITALKIIERTDACQGRMSLHHG